MYMVSLLSLCTVSFPYLTFSFTGKYGNVYGHGRQTYLYHHEEDESSFQLVDRTKVQKPLYLKGRPRFNQVCVYVWCLLQVRVHVHVSPCCRKWATDGDHCLTVGFLIFLIYMYMQQKIRRDQERREERRLGGRQQAVLRGRRDRYCILYIELLHDISMPVCVYVSRHVHVYIAQGEADEKETKEMGSIVLSAL